MNDFPHTLKLATVWLLIGTGVFLAVQWWQREQLQARISTTGGVIELRRAPDGHFHWPGSLNGEPVDFLVDTGATRTTLPQALAERLGLARGETVRSSTAGGVVVGYQTRADVDLQGGVRAEQLRLTVLPDLDAPLLGMDLIGRLHLTQQGGVLRIDTTRAVP